MITDVMNREAAKVLTLFSISPGSRFTRNEIKEKTVLNNVPLDNAITALLKNKLLKREKRLLQVNFESENAKKMLEIAKKEHLRFKEIPLRIYFILVDFSSILNNIKSVKSSYMFGSYAKLIHTDKSDIDIAVIVDKDGKNAIHKTREAAKKVEKRYRKAIELHFYNENDLRQKDPVIREINRNGICLFAAQKQQKLERHED